MDISARSYLTAGISLTAATAIAFAPLAVPESHTRVPIPHVTVSDLQLAVSPADIDALVADLQGVLDDATNTVTDLVGIPGQTLIGVVDNIVTLIDTVFTGLIDSTDNQTIEALLSVLQTFSADAFEMLAENLGRINPVITTTTAQVGDLLTSALTGSLQNILIAVVNVVDDPLSLASYAGLVTAGVAGGQLLVGTGLQAVQGLGDAGFDIAGIAVDEVMFQFNNFAIDGIGALLTELGDASGNAVVEAVLGAVQGLAIAPAVAVFNLGSGVVDTVLTTAHAGFDVLLDGATVMVDSTGNAIRSAITAIGAGPLDPASYVTALASLVVGGFDGFDAGVETFAGLARLPLSFAAGLNSTAATVLTSLNTAVAQAVSGLFRAAALPADVVALPSGIAAGVNSAVNGLSGAVDNGLETAGDLIDNGVDLALNAAAEAEAATLEILGDPDIPVMETPPAHNVQAMTLQQSPAESTAPNEDVVSVVADTGDDKAAAEEPFAADQDGDDTTADEVAETDAEDDSAAAETGTATEENASAGRESDAGDTETADSTDAGDSGKSATESER